MNGRSHEEKWTRNGKTEERNGNGERNGQTVNGIGNVFLVSTVCDMPCGHKHVSSAFYTIFPFYFFFGLSLLRLLVITLDIEHLNTYTTGTSKHQK